MPCLITEQPPKTARQATMHTCERKIMQRRGFQRPGKPDFRLNVASTCRCCLGRSQAHSLSYVFGRPLNAMMSHIRKSVGRRFCGASGHSHEVCFTTFVSDVSKQIENGNTIIIPSTQLIVLQNTRHDVFVSLNACACYL
eukprot:6480790-Amphidinium_carterae.1